MISASMNRCTKANILAIRVCLTHCIGIVSFLESTKLNLPWKWLVLSLLLFFPIGFRFWRWRDLSHSEFVLARRLASIGPSRTQLTAKFQESEWIEMSSYNSFWSRLSSTVFKYLWCCSSLPSRNNSLAIPSNSLLSALASSAVVCHLRQFTNPADQLRAEQLRLDSHLNYKSKVSGIFISIWRMD